MMEGLLVELGSCVWMVNVELDVDAEGVVRGLRCRSWKAGTHRLLDKYNRTANNTVRQQQINQFFGMISKA